MAEYAGIRWYKCDLHLHTMSSECYLDKSNTPAQWVARAIEQGLDCAAVTDHNDWRGIEEIMKEGKEQGLVVFPGVEITCDSSKIHILVLFDVNKNENTVRDFLNRCDIDSDLVGDAAGTSLSVFEVCRIAKRRGAMVIAAHIDEFNSISSMNPSNLDKFLESDLLDAVQVANPLVWEKYSRDKDEGNMIRTLQDKYGPDATPAEIDRWRKCFDRAADMKLPMVCFSDNQASPSESHHGLWGIGAVYTWIKMDNDICLESIRQALISPDSRIRTIYESPDRPKVEPDFWIKSIEVRKSVLNPFQPIRMEFNPQLNCVIGSRGSGKSAIVRLLSGVYRQLEDSMLPNVTALQEQFYHASGEDRAGIFTPESEIEICFARFGYDYRMLVTDITDSRHQKYNFYCKGNGLESEQWEEVSDLTFDTMMCAHTYVQHQAYEIASSPEALLYAVDRCIPDMYILKSRRQFYRDKIEYLSMGLRASDVLIRDKARIEAELEWLREQVKNPGNTGERTSQISSYISRREEEVELIAAQQAQIEMGKLELEKSKQDYEKCLSDIRQARSRHLQIVLKDDENYRMEVLPFANRESFRNIIKEILAVDYDMLGADIHRLEDALFAAKNGLDKYAKEMLEIRSAGTGESDQISPAAEQYSPYFRNLIGSLDDRSYERLLTFHPEDEIKISYHPNGIKRFFPLTNASAGEKAAAVLAYALFDGNEPLVMDQPEDDLDNRVIYEEIVPKIKRAKQLRQMIIVTHNANIAANADAEMIISMEPKSKFIRVHAQGTMDDPEIRREICDAMEGSEEAFTRRARKYHL